MMKRQVTGLRIRTGLPEIFGTAAEPEKSLSDGDFLPEIFYSEIRRKADFPIKKNPSIGKDSLRPKQSAYLSGGRPAYSLAKSEKLSMM